jgi:spore cortex formation protein SpoVR/YcgB (stage V sporulation)
VQQSSNPEEKLLEFLNSTYHTGANLAKWDRELLEVEYGPNPNNSSQ